MKKLINDDTNYATYVGRSSSFETDAEKVFRLENEKQQLIEELALERMMRKNAEDSAEKLKAKMQEIATLMQKRKRRTRSEIEADGKEVYSEYKTDGKRKARPAESIQSYEEFASIQNYFLERGKVRDWMMWTVGVSLGLRVSDLLSLKVGELLNEDFTFKDRIIIIEKKTSKANNCLITESVKDALTKYFISINYQIKFDDFLFQSRKTKSKMYEEYGWKILSDAGKALKLPINIGSHTMRKSFANIVACVDNSTIDMNSITKIQGLLNHSDQKVTMRYLGTYQRMFDKARECVSDFVLGKTNVHELVAGNKTNYTIDDVISKLDILEEKCTHKEDFE